MGDFAEPSQGVYNCCLLDHNAAKNNALYAACMSVAALVEPVTWRIQPNAAPAPLISSTCRHELPYWVKWSKPNGSAARIIPRTAPKLLTSRGWTKPRKASSSARG